MRAMGRGARMMRGGCEDPYVIQRPTVDAPAADAWRPETRDAEGSDGSLQWEARPEIEGSSTSNLGSNWVDFIRPRISRKTYLEFGLFRSPRHS